MSVSKKVTEASRLAELHVNKECPKVSSADKPEAIGFMQNFFSHEAYKNPSYKWSLNDFELGHRVGRGKFGRVFLARENKTGYIVAIKTMSKREIVEGHVERQVMREIEIQSNLKHPRILQLLTWFHDDFRIFLVTEYAGQGELYTVLKAAPDGRFDDHRAAKYTYQVADALDYCHTQQVIHRDIKPENLLLTIHGDVLLADFGWSVHAPSQRRKTMCGTLDYLPPEMVCNEIYGKYVDHWCLGVLCYEFLCGNPPFESSTTDLTYTKIKQIDVHFPQHMTAGAKHLIRSLLCLDANKRLALPGVMKHPWIEANVNKKNEP